MINNYNNNEPVIIEKKRMLMETAISGESNMIKKEDENTYLKPYTLL
jgi:hypothetical protein